MKRQTLIELVVFVLLILAGSQLRIALQYLPNFAPVAALALFAGFFFRSPVVALCVPLSIMVISDLAIGGYPWYQMAVVYSALALPVLMRGFMRRHFTFDGEQPWRRWLLPVASLLACSLAGSLFFFVSTNAVCLRWYEPTPAGVLSCYLQALPFFRFTLYGDLFFAFATFGSYALAASFGWSIEANANKTAVGTA